MLALLSPAKSMDFESPALTDVSTSPSLAEHTDRLAAKLKKTSTSKLKSLMGLSDALAQLNTDRYQSFVTSASEETPEQARQAILAFDGDTYSQMNLEDLDAEGWERVQARIRILSGLYGVLRPLDLIQPYRLEMGTKLTTRRGKNLYEFWGSRITNEINAQARELGATHIVNCASNEYFKAVKKKELEVPVITPVFKDYKKGEYKVISFFAKKARGAMAAHIARHDLTEPADLHGFDHGGYTYDAELSSELSPVFTRRLEG